MLALLTLVQAMPLPAYMHHGQIGSVLRLVNLCSTTFSFTAPY
ncbi:hypothetical protein PISS_a2732 [Pseudoalteromonas issachenkonii]|uniref:Uncharacterized protein n=1 Tax=Pseudoalteromonas issachenkonii TaxID=152297 RepID=A0ABN5C5W7_9GAMM|nr:hypothetical protein PISS_a2732 [Pseudoalteromonas issachenkonii]